MQSKKKDLAYYKALNYDVIVRKIDKEEYGKPFYQAFARELDAFAFYGVGDTPEEAIRCFQETKEGLFVDHLENGIDIPEPEAEEDVLYSGKFLVRVPPILHRRLIGLAKKNRQSLNSYIYGVLERTTTADDIMEMAKQALCAAFHAQAERYLSSIYTFERSHAQAPGQTEVKAA